jgi:Anaphase-promoting complex, subunit 10 (APC10)
MDRTPPAGLNLVPAAIRWERLIRGIPQIRIGANREAFARGVVELANGLFRRRAVPMEIDTPFDPSALGLKEIGNLASWTVSSCKPGCGVEALRDEDTGLFWQ